MKTTDRNALITFPSLILIGLLTATAGSQGGSRVAGIPVFALLAALFLWTGSRTYAADAARARQVELEVEGAKKMAG